MKIKALIFDLDNSLAPSRSVGESRYEPAFEAIRKVNAGALSEDQLEAAFADLWDSPLDWVAEEYGFTPMMLDAAWDHFSELQADGGFTSYEDIHVLDELSPLKFLVTSGFRKLQQSKIDALGLSEKFDGIVIDAIDEEDHEGKEKIFKKLMEEHHLNPTEVVVVGDSATSELAAGNRIGMITLQILRPGVKPSDMASHHISSLEEIKDMLAN